MKVLRLWSISILLFLTALSADYAVQAQTRTPTPTPVDAVLFASSPVQGTLSNAKPQALYRYSGLRGEQLTVVVETLKGLTVGVTLRFESGEKFPTGATEQTFKVGKNTAGESNFRLPETADYLIRVQRGTDSTGGAFTLRLDSDLSQADQPGNRGVKYTFRGATLPAKIDATQIASKVVTVFQTAKVLPKGGKQVLIQDTAFGKTSDEGISFLPIGRGLNVQNLALQYTVSWNTIGTESGCGFMFRASYTEPNNITTFITPESDVYLIHQSGRQIGIGYKNNSTLFVPGKSTIVTVLAFDEEVALYLNGTLEMVETTTADPVKGGTALVVYNEDGNKVLSDCRFRNIWMWSLD
jgi:hypothetical protein